MLNGAHASKTIIATCETNPEFHQRYLLQGAEILVCREYDGRVEMTDLLRKLTVRGAEHPAGRVAAVWLVICCNITLIDECIFSMLQR